MKRLRAWNERRRAWVDRRWRHMAIAWYSLGLVWALVAFSAPFWNPSYGVYRVLAALPVAMFIPLASFEIVRLLAAMQHERVAAQLPHVVNILQQDDDGQVVAVTRQNGETVMVTLPPDYDPRDDGGEALMRQVVPEFFEKGGIFEHAAQPQEDEDE